MPIVCIDGAEIKITVNGPQVLVKTTDNIPSATNNKLAIAGKPVLVEDDVRQWLSAFQTNYDNASYKAGMAQGNAITQPANVTVKGLSTKGMVTKDTKVGAILQVTAPGVDSLGVSDGVPIINIMIEFTDPAQDKFIAE